MEDKPKPPNAKAEGPNRSKEGYVQLAEKMEQVKNQMAKMERKYDELYQTVKEANKIHDEVPSKDSISPDEYRPLSEPGGKMGPSSAKFSLVSEPGSERPQEDKPNDKSNPNPNSADIEKMEDNPFM